MKDLFQTIMEDVVDRVGEHFDKKDTLTKAEYEAIVEQAFAKQGYTRKS